MQNDPNTLTSHMLMWFEPIHTGKAAALCGCLDCQVDRQGAIQAHIPQAAPNKDEQAPSYEAQKVYINSQREINTRELEDIKRQIDGLLQQIVYLQSRIGSL